MKVSQNRFFQKDIELPIMKFYFYCSFISINTVVSYLNCTLSFLPTNAYHKIKKSIHRDKYAICNSYISISMTSGAHLK